MNDIDKKIIAGERISVDDAIELLNSNDLYRLGYLAGEVRKRLHPDKIVTYVVDRNINYTNICWVDCKFCAFCGKKVF